jgi:hypothetical protein
MSGAPDLRPSRWGRACCTTGSCSASGSALARRRGSIGAVRRYYRSDPTPTLDAGAGTDATTGRGSSRAGLEDARGDALA